MRLIAIAPRIMIMISIGIIITIGFIIDNDEEGNLTLLEDIVVLLLVNGVALLLVILEDEEGDIGVKYKVSVILLLTLIIPEVLETK